MEVIGERKTVRSFVIVRSRCFLNHQFPHQQQSRHLILLIFSAVLFLANVEIYQQQKQSCFNFHPCLLLSVLLIIPTSQISPNASEISSCSSWVSTIPIGGLLFWREKDGIWEKKISGSLSLVHSLISSFPSFSFLLVKYPTWISRFN